MNTKRKSRVDKILETHEFSALILWRPDELVLTLGYRPQWGLSFLLYTEDGDPVLFVPELEPEDLLPTDITIRKFPWASFLLLIRGAYFTKK